MDLNLIGGVVILKNDEGKELLVKQSKTKPFSGYWRHPGGKFNSNESYEVGLRRELKEELGLEIELLDKIPIFIEKSEYDEGYFGFFKGIITGGKLKIESREIEEANWFSSKEIKKLPLMKATEKFYEQIKEI